MWYIFPFQAYFVIVNVTPEKNVRKKGVVIFHSNAQCSRVRVRKWMLPSYRESYVN